MTQTLKTLARIKKNDLNFLRRQIALMEHQETHLEDLIKTLKRNCAKEYAFCQSTPDYSFILDIYLEVNRQQQIKIASDLEALHLRIAHFREELYNTFGEEKRYEILQERRIEEEHTCLMQQEGRDLNEIGLVQWQKESHT